MRRAAFVALSLLLSAATPALASTVPDAGLRQGEIAVTAGLLDASVDWAFLDRLQAGVGGYGTAFGAGAYGRLTYRLFDSTPLGDIGLHLAGGTFSPVLVKTADDGQFVFVGPVLKRAIGNVVVLRASLGLIATNSHNIVRTPNSAYAAGFEPITSRSWGLGISDGMMIPIIPNLEVAFRLGGNHELTLGGNAIIGWRNRF